MPIYRYEAIDSQGASIKEQVEALTEREAVSKIRHRGYFPIRITPPDGPKKTSKTIEQWGHSQRPSGKVKAGAVAEFARELATLQEAGLPILRSLRSLEEQEKSKTFRKVIGHIADDIEGGATLSEAMGKFPNCFDRLFVGMVAAGEKGGVLELILNRLADFAEKTERIKARVKSAMIYPIVVLSVAFGVLLFLMTFVIPRFQDVLAEMGAKLNVLTRGVFAVASWVANDYGWAVLLAVPLGFILLYRVVGKFRSSRLIVDRIKLKIPILGKLLRKVCITRWTRTLGTLLGAGVPILDAIALTSQTTGNEVFSRTLIKIQDAIRQGDTFVNPLRQSKTVTSSVANMIAVGEETGDLDKMLIKVADKYDDQVDVLVASMVSLLEPLVIVVLGIIVMLIILAILLPIFDIIVRGIPM